jgi:hypothetical protein
MGRVTRILKRLGTRRDADGNLHSEEETELYTAHREKTDRYYQVYDNYADAILDLHHADDFRVLHLLCKMCKYEESSVAIPTSLRKDICKRLDIHTVQMSNSLKRLKDVGILTGTGGDYQLNPEMFWRGATSARKKKLKGEEIKEDNSDKATRPQEFYDGLARLQEKMDNA